MDLPPPSATSQGTLQYVTSSATAQPMPPTVENIHLLNQAAEYRRFTRLLRSGAIYDLLIGAMAMLIGVALLSMSLRMTSHLLFLSISVAVTGALLVGVSTWNLASPSPLGLLANGALMIMLALYNLRWIFEPSTPGQSKHTQYIVAFVLTMLGGLARLRNYPKFKLVAPDKPSTATMQWIGQMIRYLKTARLESTPNLIKWQSINAFPPVSVDALLLEDMAICLVNRSRLRLLTRDQISMQLPREIPSGKRKIKVPCMFEDKQFKALLKIESAQRFQAWKSLPADDAVILEEA